MTGLIQYFGIAASDGGSPSYKGIITGGRHAIPSEIREQRGIGSPYAFDKVPGLLTPNGTVDFVAQDKTIIDLAIRTTGELSEFGVACGDTAWNALYKYCKCSSLSLRGAAGEELTGSMSWMAKQAVEGAGAQVQTAEVDIPLMWHAFTITGLTGLEITSFDATITHRLIQQPVLETPASNIKRFPKYVLDTGQDLVSLTLTLLAQDTSKDITADDLAEIASIGIAFVGTKTLNLAFSGCLLSEKNEDFTPAAMASKGLIFLCDNLSATYQ